MALRIFIGMKHSKHIIPIALGLLIIALLFCTFRMCNHKPETITVTDTVTMERTDTVYDTARLIHYFPRPIHDTILRWNYIKQDTLLPYISKTYSDTVTKDDGAEVQYIASVSGVDPSLDSIRFNLKYPVVTNTITNTVTETKFLTKPAPRFSVGIQAGFGYGVFNKKPDLYIGLGGTYRF